MKTTIKAALLSMGVLPFGLVTAQEPTQHNAETDKQFRIETLTTMVSTESVVQSLESQQKPAPEKNINTIQIQNAQTQNARLHNVQFQKDQPQNEQEQKQRIAHYQRRAQALQLDQQPTWQRLYYVKAEAPGQSEVKYAGFFLNGTAPLDLRVELNLAISALFSTEQNNQAFRCRFPARSQWLIQQLNIPTQELAEFKCEEFSNWFQQINPHKITLIYATDFMGNPSSMFGHTLLRIDPKDQAQLNLVSYAVNYAATVHDFDNWAYAWKGLTGQYPGEYSLMSYFKKVKEYADFESRDLWEYELDLSPEQSQFLVMHLWELQHVSFPYYFISDNCSYRLLGLIDLVQPDAQLQSRFKHSAVPVETIKAIQKQGLVRDTVYRAALETQLLAQSRQHGRALSQQAHRLTQTKVSDMPTEIAKYDTGSQAKILEMAYDDLYLQLIARKQTATEAQPRLRTVLAMRSQLEIDKQRQPVARPAHDPTEAHDVRFWSLSAGRVQDQNVIQLGYRQAYHDLMDPQGGLRMGTQMQFLDGSLQWRDDRLKLDYFNFLNVNSYNPIHAFKTPLSWGFNSAWQQEAVHNGKFSSKEQHGVMSVKAQGGYSVASQSLQHQCYLQAQTYLQAGKSLDQGWRFGVGPTMGCQNIWSEHVHSLLQIELPYWQDASAWNLRINSAIQYVINPQNALRLNVDYQQQHQVDWFGTRLGYFHYF